MPRRYADPDRKTLPTPAEIAAATAEIRANWSETTHLARSGGLTKQDAEERSRWYVPEVAPLLPSGVSPESMLDY